MYPFQPAFTPITPKELSVSDTTFKVFVLLQGIEPCFHSYQECVLTILLQEQIRGLSPLGYGLFRLSRHINRPLRIVRISKSRPVA